MKNKQLTVIIPAYNEDQSEIDLLTMTFDKQGIDYIVVDDGSDIPVESYNVLRRERNKGYGNAIKWGVRHAKGNYIAIIDADGQYDPIELLEMWDSMEDEDMLIGKRINHQGGFRRTVGRLFLNLIASLFCGKLIKDLNSGSRIFKKNIAKNYFSILCDEFSFTSSLTMCMMIEKYKVKWVPVSFFPRQGSPSTVKMVYHGLVTLYQIIYITLGLRTRKFRAWLRG